MYNMNLFQSYKTPTRRKKRNTRKVKRHVIKIRKTKKRGGKKRKFGDTGNDSEGSNESFNLEDSDEYSDIEMAPQPPIVRNRLPPNPREDTSDSDADSIVSNIHYPPSRTLTQIENSINYYIEDIREILRIIHFFYIEIGRHYARYYPHRVQPHQILKGILILSHQSFAELMYVLDENNDIFLSIIDSIIYSTPVNYTSVHYICDFITREFNSVRIETNIVKRKTLELHTQLDRHLHEQPHHPDIHRLKKLVVLLYRQELRLPFSSLMQSKLTELKRHVTNYENAHGLNTNSDNSEHEDEDED